MSDIFHQPLSHWWDVVDPTPEVLRGIADRFKLHHTSVQDCLDPEHFPKIKKSWRYPFYDRALSRS